MIANIDYSFVFFANPLKLSFNYLLWLFFFVHLKVVKILFCHSSYTYNYIFIYFLLFFILSYVFSKLYIFVLSSRLHPGWLFCSNIRRLLIGITGEKNCSGAQQNEQRLLTSLRIFRSYCLCFINIRQELLFQRALSSSIKLFVFK